MEEKINLLCKAMSDVIENQIQIMEHIGLLREYEDKYDELCNISKELYEIADMNDDY